MYYIKHKRENVTFHTFKSFMDKVEEHYGPINLRIDEKNRGVYIEGKLVRWVKLASEMEWFDDAEIVTDKNENERVMTWLNI